MRLESKRLDPRTARERSTPEQPTARLSKPFLRLVAAAWLLLLSPQAPSAAEAEQAEKGKLPVPVRVEPERGVFEAPVEVRLLPRSAEVRVRFTTDGSEPTLENGADYDGPWTFKQTTLLRVRPYVKEQALTASTTHSFLFLDSVLRQPRRPRGFPNGPGAWEGEPASYSLDSRIVEDPRYGAQLKPALRALPSLSIVCPLPDLFGASQGLYVNAQARGPSWEKAASLEWIETNGASGFQVNAGLRMQGNTGRRADKSPKHSFRVLFKEQYGPTKLRYRVFPDSPAAKFDTLVLRADYNNSWTHWNPDDNQRAQRIRDAWLKDSHRAMGWLAGHSRFVHLYLNGLYWGIYDVAERPDATFAANYLGGKKEDYEARDDSGYKDADNMSPRTRGPRLRRGEPLTLESAGALVDVVQFIDYLLLNYYAGNGDWGGGKNWYTIKRKEGQDVLRYYVWDGEMILQGLQDDIINEPPRPPFGLARRLAEDPEYRLAFADRVQRHCFGTGALTPARCLDRWKERASQLQLAIVAESARWGAYRRDPPFTRDIDWVAEQNRLLKHYFPKRTAILLRQLRSAGLYPELAAPLWKGGEPQANGGRVVEFVAMPEATVYYTTNGMDPRTKLTGDPAAEATTYRSPFTLPSDLPLKARARREGVWSALVELSPLKGR